VGARRSASISSKGDIRFEKPAPRWGFDRCSQGVANVLSEPYFTDEQAAFDRLEEIGWPDGIVCPQCGTIGKAVALTGVKDKKGRIRPGLKKCYACRKQFTVRVGTVFEASHVPLHVWFQAAFLLCSSKKGISSNQLHRTLGVTLKTAWFMSHRLREAMTVLGMEPMGGEGKAVEADETFIGNKRPKAPTLAAMTTSTRSGLWSSAAARFAPSTSTT
jgi:transposase-like protein